MKAVALERLLLEHNVGAIIRTDAHVLLAEGLDLGLDGGSGLFRIISIPSSRS